MITKDAMEQASLVSAIQKQTHRQYSLSCMPQQTNQLSRESIEMRPILTDDEILAVLGEDKDNDPELCSDVLEDARAVIAAYEAKLREQEPVAWRKLLCFENGANEYKFSSVNVLKDGDPLYLHPAPIPEGYVLVPIEPTKEMISAMQSSGWMPGNYKAMLAAARSE